MHKHLTLLGCLVLLLLAGCAGERTIGAPVPATATASPTPTSTATTAGPPPTPSAAATPTNVPAGWQVLVGHYFAIAYPAGWVAQPPQPITDTTSANASGYIDDLTTSDGRTLSVLERHDSEIAGSYCHVDNSVVKTLAGVPMRYIIAGNAHDTRDWTYADSQGTLYEISINDALSPAHITVDDTLLATLRVADSTPFTC